MSATATDDERIVWRTRLVAACLALVALAFRQASGRIVPDTKLDLTVSPWSFLGDALHLWDPQGYFGQLQNQAYGYLFPMGPFHGVLLSAGVPAWIVQRLWWSTLLVLACVGTWRLAGELRLGSPALRLVGAVAYAVSPRILSELTTTSVEVWPMALAPWVLLPLAVRTERSWSWRITRSALAVALCGGVNAVATGAVLVLPAVWLLTRRPLRAHIGVALAWLGAVVLAIAWWLVPLGLLGRYSPPFLDWIESAAVTTSTASPFQAFRGTSAWLGFLALPSGAQWPGGWAFVTTAPLIVATAMAAAIGLYGLTRPGVTERSFLLASVATGLLLTTLGHVATAGPPWAGAVQDLLDGPLAALRNTHKFDLVIRLPLALGLVAGLDAMGRMLARAGVQRWTRLTAVAALLTALAGPALSGGLARAEGYAEIPGYWRQAAAWLDRQPEPGAVLTLPAASFSDFLWGSTKDNPLQALTHRPFVARDAVPLGSAGSTRFLDEIQRAVASGQADTGLGAALAAAGVRYVLVPADLRPDAISDPILAVEQGLRAAGLRPVADFGTALPGLTRESAWETTDYRTRLEGPALRIYAVPDTAAAAMVPQSEVVTALGGPEDTTTLAGAGQPYALLGSDAAALEPGATLAGARVLTDGLQRREVDFGAPAYNSSPVLQPGEIFRADRPAHDFIADPAAPQTYAGWRGIAGVRVSSSASDAGASLRIGEWAAPAAALDGDVATRWVSGRLGRAEGEWFEIRLDRMRSLGGIRVQASADSPVGAMPRTITVTTRAGARDIQVDENGFGIASLPTGATDWIRLTMRSRGAGSANGFALAEVAVEGMSATPVLAPPAADRPAQILLRRADHARGACVTLTDHDLCGPTLEVPADPSPGIQRRLTLAREASYAMTGQVVATQGAESLLANPTGLQAQASSRLTTDLRNRPGAAVDGDMGTAWVASRLDFAPRLTIRLPKERRITGIQFLRRADLAASAPREVTVRFGDGEPVTGQVDDEGYLRFPARTTRLVRISFGATRPLVNTDGRDGARTFVPVGASEVRLLGAENLVRPPDPSADTGAACGFGPAITIGSSTVPTRVEGTVADLLAGRPLSWSTCPGDTVTIPAGTSEVSADASGQFTPTTLALGSVTTARARTLTVDRPGPASLRLNLPSTDTAQVIVVPQNFNVGWRARLDDGRAATPVRVNGWMQGWQVPAGAGAVLSASFTPDPAYRGALLAGGLGLAVLLALLARSRGASKGWGPVGTHPAGDLRSWWAVTAAVIGTGAVIGGGPGLLAGVLAAGLGWWLRDRRAVGVALVAGTAVAVVLSAADPWPSGSSGLTSPWVQGGVLLAVCGAILSVRAPQRPPRESARHAGPSASRGVPWRRS